MDHGNLPACRLLLDYGADPNMSPIPLKYEVECLRGKYNMLIKRRLQPIWTNKPRAQIACLLAQSCDVVITVTELLLANDSIENFLALQEFLDTPYYDLPLAVRIRLAMKMMAWFQTANPDVIRIAVSQGPCGTLSSALNTVRITDYRYKDYTLLHAVTGTIRELICVASGKYLAGSVAQPRLMFNQSITL